MAEKKRAAACKATLELRAVATAVVQTAGKIGLFAGVRVVQKSEQPCFFDVSRNASGNAESSCDGKNAHQEPGIPQA